MVTQPTAPRNTAATRKPKPSTARLPRPTTGKQRPSVASKQAAYRPRIQFAGPNDYLVPSESYAPHLVYLVTVLGRAWPSANVMGTNSARRASTLI